MKRPFKLLGLLVMPLMAFAGEVTVTSVTAQQRYPWNGLVDVIVKIQGMADAVIVSECAFVATNSATSEAIVVEHITRNGEDSCSGNVWTRKYVWDAVADVGAVKIDDVALTADAKVLDYVQLWEDGPYWARCNVGATKPEECGYYFWWGDTVGYKRNVRNDGWVSVKDSTAHSFKDCPTDGESNSKLRLAGYIDAAGNLVTVHDAATAHRGATWRMPTDAEFAMLISKCYTEWTSRNGVVGRLVKGRGSYALKSIFLPAAGHGSGTDLDCLGTNGNYWSSTPNSDGSYTAWELGFFSSGFIRSSYYHRYYGLSVRPVREFAK